LHSVLKKIITGSTHIKIDKWIDIISLMLFMFCATY